MKPLLIKNAHIVDPASGFDATGALLVENGLISARTAGASPGAPEGAQIIDAKGMLLAPGLIDMRVFTGEPGREYRETLSSAAQAAAAGGVTSFVCMPDTMPVIDDGAVVDFIIRRAEANSLVNILVSAAITKGLEGKEICEFGLLKEAGAICLSDGRRSIQSAALLRHAFYYAKNFEMPVIHHLSDYGLSGGGVMNKGLFATTLGLKGIAPEAQSIPLMRDLALAEITGASYHAAQISTPASLEAMAGARQKTANVSAGISINNLCLNEIDIGSYRTFFKLDPPLGSEESRMALVAGLKSGVIDTIHSGHDPQDVEVKRRPFAEAAFGAIGLETLFSAAMRLVHSGDVELKTILAAMTINPARILKLASGRLSPGAPADFLLADLDYPWVASANSIISRSKNSPFEDARFSAKIMATYVGGRLVYKYEGEKA
ncbi:Dihydroorotase [hydrothermal vent metagenome]|uniref:Dihydroorotase n=1 Tax=hydrothermal vent metagenome TaxID=652676 RepID=A0A3B0TDY3_9ZZZZ